MTAERIRDKVARTKRKGKYCGGMPVLCYSVDRVRKRLVVDPEEAKRRVEELARAHLDYDALRIVFEDGSFYYLPERGPGS